MGVVLPAIFLLIAATEVIWPNRPATALTRRRWLGNLLLLAFGIAASSIPFFAAILAASDGERGVFGELGLPGIVAVPLGILILDGAGYAMHRLDHAVAPLWRLHAVHHSDPEMDITTTVRAHPVAVVLSNFVTAAIVVVVGIPATAVLAFRVAELVVQCLAHANIALPARLSRVIVTPAFHHLHHSPEMVETNSNYGQVFAVWDHLFGTARAPSGREARFGLAGFDAPGQQDIHALLIQPVLPRPREPTAEPVAR